MPKFKHIRDTNYLSVRNGCLNLVRGASLSEPHLVTTAAALSVYTNSVQAHLFRLVVGMPLAV